MKNIQKLIQKLIINECACYSAILNGVKNYCDKEKEKGCICSLFKNKRCDYFEKSVLPMNPQLEALYKAEHIAKLADFELTKEDKQRIVEGKSPIAGKVQVHCKKCGKIFQADNYRQQYCDRCKRYIRRENQREWIKNKRDVNVDNQPSKTVDI